MLKYKKGLNNIFLKDKLSVYRDQRRNKLKSLVFKIYSNSFSDTDSLENLQCFHASRPKPQQKEIPVS